MKEFQGVKPLPGELQVSKFFRALRQMRKIMLKERIFWRNRLRLDHKCICRFWLLRWKILPFAHCPFRLSRWIFLLVVDFETQVSDSLMNFPTYLNCKNKDLSVINIFTKNIQKHSVYVHLICFSLHESFMIFSNFLIDCDENTTEHSSWSSRNKSSSHQEPA